MSDGIIKLKLKMELFFSRDNVLKILVSVNNTRRASLTEKRFHGLHNSNSIPCLKEGRKAN